MRYIAGCRPILHLTPMSQHFFRPNDVTPDESISQVNADPDDIEDDDSDICGDGSDVQLTSTSFFHSRDTNSHIAKRSNSTSSESAYFDVNEDNIDQVARFLKVFTYNGLY
jgi:hypothetical protein